jgi:hypothetical protein
MRLQVADRVIGVAAVAVGTGDRGQAESWRRRRKADLRTKVVGQRPSVVRRGPLDRNLLQRDSEQRHDRDANCKHGACGVNWRAVALYGDRRYSEYQRNKRPHTEQPDP